MRKTLWAASATLLLAACATPTPQGTETLAVGQFIDRDGNPSGTVELVASGPSLTLRAEAYGLEQRQGERGFHIHTTGRCDPPDFTSAEHHLNPADNDHGPFNADGGHLGDLLNISVNAQGVARIDYPFPGRRSELLPHIFDADGSAVIIHAKPDDYQTDPGGGAGDRVLCAVLNPTP
jgi:Cu-Zn family superoxide dismutase